MSFGFECIGCGGLLFQREENAFHEDEEDTCPDCGMMHSIGLEDDKADLRTTEHYTDIGQPRCDNTCGLVAVDQPLIAAEFLATPCSWTCPLTRAWRTAGLRDRE